MQADLTKLLLNAVANTIDDKTATYLKEADAAIQGIKNDNALIIFLQAGQLKRLIRIAPAKLKTAYGWRNSAILRQAQQRFNIDYHNIDPSVLEILRNGGLIDPPSDPDTNYIAACREQDVPIPADFSLTSVNWHYQGDLTYNILNRREPNSTASVYTYSDPLLRGACIALPRGAINPMTGAFITGVAGIICQSASTGRACFWDNLERDGGEMARTIPWNSETLVIRQLQDGDMLRETCTGCHTGNNVFLMTPDDSAWRKVMRGPLNGSIGTFTTRIEGSPGVPNPTARYTPVSAMTPPKWRNPAGSAGCSGSCHEAPSRLLLDAWNDFSTLHDPTGRLMPPICASLGGVEGCYNSGL